MSIQRDEHKDPLRFSLCGSSGDGRSTLVRRLLRESPSLSSEQVGPAHDHLSTERRRFIVVDAPDHGRYSPHMVTGASTLECAVILIDAGKGILTQTRSDSYLVSLLGIGHVVVAVNKMDAVVYEEAAFRAIEREHLEFAARVGLTDVTCIPVSALNGDNVLERGEKLSWFDGPSLIGYLEAVRVQRPRGDDAIPARATPPQVSDQLQATIVWMHDDPLLRGRSYLMRIGTGTVTATIAPLKYRVNVDSLEHVAANKLELNEIGVCDLELSRPVAFDPYEHNRDTGAFILIDRITNDTVGAGMIHFALRRAQNIRWQELTVDRTARAAHKQQVPCVLWFTGLSGAGKSTIANRVEVELHGRGQHTYMLDGDNVRHGLNRDLGFTDADRVENIRRVAEVCRLMIDAGLIVLVSFISPFRSERQMARALFDETEFFEVFVDTPLAVAEKRDPKGLYKKARRGELRHFTGIDSPYEPPENAELRLDTTALSAAEAAAAVIALLERRDLLPPG